MKRTSLTLRRIAHIRFARAKRWIRGPERDTFNAYVALSEALFWRNLAGRAESKERIAAARERSARIEAAMKEPSDA